MKMMIKLIMIMKHIKRDKRDYVVNNKIMGILIHNINIKNLNII